MSGRDEIVPGQRWLSEAEPELGLGTVVGADRRSLVLRFEAAGEERRYAAGSAPLHRVVLGAGDELIDREGRRLEIDAVEQRHGLAFYLCGDRVVPEAELSPTMAVGGPRERLLAGRLEAPAAFELRRETLERLERAGRSPVRGLVGPRVELLPHQFSIAAEVASRRRPRVLLADETGLGKTIEAGLILHRLLLTGRVRRALVLVPEPLIHQWLVELRRRFHLRVALHDEERCRAIEAAEPGANPFEAEQLVLAGWELLASDERRAEQAAAAGWELVIVDEAHHLSGRRGETSPACRAVERVSAGGGLLLLTATPTQLGEEGHFARLRLLDPERHADFATWRREEEGHHETARLGAALAAEEALSPEQLRTLAAVFRTSPDALAGRLETREGRTAVLHELIDRHGPGRVMFRNTRAVLSRRPRRRVRLHPLASEAARMDRLVALLREAEGEKLLVLCREAATTLAIEQALRQRLRIDVALFHEELSLLQRDRNAAWFVDPDGAQVLVGSEIGSEGRNFQVARRLVMFDLPLDPDLVEQRVGRVDRIGQQGDVRIDVPYLEGSGEEVLARWHHEGLGVFERPTGIGEALLERLGERVRELAARWDAGAGGSEGAEAELQALLDETAATAAELELRLAEGRDRLLEMSSLDRERACSLLEQVLASDRDTSLEAWFLRLLEHFHVVAEELGPRSYRFDREGLAAVRFAALARGDVGFTFDRETALLREDLEFGGIDHPLLRDAAELLLASEAGTASFAVRERPGPAALLLEAVFVLETLAPRDLDADRFLPPTALRVVVDHAGEERPEEAAELDGLEAAELSWFRGRLPELRPALQAMLARAEELAEQRAERLRELASEELVAALDAELRRLRELAERNELVRDEEIALLEGEAEALERHVERARLRLDSLRLVWSGPLGGAGPERAAPR